MYGERMQTVTFHAHTVFTESTGNMWPFSKRQTSTLEANSVHMENGTAIIDVRGQTCPGYLLAINKAVERLEPDTAAKLLITYPPCGKT